MKSTPANASSRSRDNARRAPSREEIAARAEALWRQRGRPQGCDEEIWLEAERRLRRLAFIEADERDEIALADPSRGFDRESDGLMGELEDRFPGQEGRETTSL